MPWRHPHTVVDTHCHAGRRKYEPVEALVDQMFRNGVDQAVLVQHMGEYDNRYLSECSTRFPGRFAVAALVDVRQPEAAGAVARAAELPGVRGLRLECGDPEALWERAHELGLVVTLRGRLEGMADPALRRLIARHDRLRVCLEHMAFPDATEAPPYPTYRQALTLAELPHVFIKVSGYYSFTQGGYPYAGVQPFTDLILATFGPRRMMWGSDFPPVSSREGYGNSLAFMEQLFPGLSADERAWLMGKTAQQVWGLPAA